eukprot:g9703.t1 g9703   contig4:377242-379185(-)
MADSTDNNDALQSTFTTSYEDTSSNTMSVAGVVNEADDVNRVTRPSNDDVGYESADRHATANEPDGAVDVNDGDAASSSYFMRGYTPLNFDMNAMVMADDSDDEDDDVGAQHHVVRGNINDEVMRGDMFTSGYYHMAAPTRRINGVKDHVAGIASVREEGGGGAHTHGHAESESDPESEENDLVSADFALLAEQALRGLDEEHRFVLGGSDQLSLGVEAQTTAASALSSSATNEAAAAGTHESDLKLPTETPMKDEDPETTESLAFEACFESDMDQTATASATFASTSKLPKPIMKLKPPSKAKAMDVNAIQKAMESIRIKAPQLATNLDAAAKASSVAYTAIINYTCQSIQQSQMHQKLLHHTIIPPGPLAAFRRHTPKAKASAHNLSRSATMAETVERLWPLICFRRRMKEAQSINTFSIHILGSDGVECSSEELVRKAVGPFVRWLDAALHSGALSSAGESATPTVDTLQVEFSGPNMPDFILGREVDLLPQSNTQPKGLSSAKAIFQRREYHESVKDGDATAPDLAIAFNAGIWGYDSWKPTLAYMLSKDTTHDDESKDEGGTLFVITAYTVEECEDDAEVVVEVAGEVATKRKDASTSKVAHQIWAPEPNPFSSRLERKTASAPQGRLYFENGAWQAWLLGL